VLAGAVHVGEATAYAPPATEPELYVRALVARHGSRAGRELLRVADELARERGVSLLRVDCYAGGDEALVRFYESAGYTRTDTFEVKGWPGQVLERRLT
jgi:GNAT superfamily N-acetyltransferase